MSRHQPLQPVRRDREYISDFDYPSSYDRAPKSSGCGCFGILLLAVLILFGYIFITLAIKGLFN